MDLLSSPTQFIRITGGLPADVDHADAPGDDDVRVETDHEGAGRHRIPPTPTSGVSRLIAAVRSNPLARNSSMVMASTAVNGVLGFVYWGAAARGYSAQTVGVATALLSAMTLVSLVATLGLGQTVIQRLPRAQDGTWSLLVNAVVFAGGTSGAVIGTAGVLVLPLLSEHFALVADPGFVCLMVVGTAVLTVANLLDYIFIAQRAAHHVLSRSALFGITKLALLLAPLALAWLGVTVVIASWIAGAAVTSVVTMRWLVPRLGHSHRWTPRGVAKLMRDLAPQLLLNHLISLSAVLVPTVMPMLVVARLSAEDNAYFYISWLIANILLTVSAAVAGSMLAEGSYDPSALAAQVRKGAGLISGLLIGPMLVLCLAGRPLLGLFGDQYAQHAYGPLLLFLLVVAPDAVTNIYITVLRVRGEHRIAAVVNVLMSLVTLVLAWVLLPHLGVAGAGVSWAVGQVVGVLFLIVRLVVVRLRGRNGIAEKMGITL
jgi:O-antigen/teichoic acid export membrane protein